MAQVNVSIGGKQYRMACEDGQEEHLAALAARLDRAIAELRRRFGDDIDEQRLTVMAAMTFADRQADAERRLAAAEEARSADQTGLTDALDTLATRIETLAARVAGVDTSADE